MKATEGNGGAPIVTSREPVERPTIPRGVLQIPTQDIVQFHEDDTITFTVAAPDRAPFVVTYHRVRTMAGDADYVVVDVGAGAVVTWDAVA